MAKYLLIIFVLATLIGYKVIKNVPSLLHTPLMSGMNALSGITVLGALISAVTSVKTGSKALAVIAIVFAMINVVGGFKVTDRMLRMFKTEEK